MFNTEKNIDEYYLSAKYYFEDDYLNIESLIAKQGQSLRIRKSSLEFKLMDKNFKRTKKINKKK